MDAPLGADARAKRWPAPTRGGPALDRPAPGLAAVARPSPGPAVTTASVVVGATAVALWLRIGGLAGWDGTFSVDEARLALAARGLLEHGAPILPSGWTYTRGLLSTALVALSFAFLGESDFAARLPSVLAGTALVPVMYLLGRALAGRPGGLFAALFVATYPPLVVWSRQAWLYAPYALSYALALLFIVRAHQGGRGRDQITASGLVGLSFFAHELGAFLLLPVGLQVAARLASLRRMPGSSETADARTARHGAALPLASLGLAFAAGVGLWLLVASLRADTLVGSYGEVREYWGPHLEGRPFRFYARMLADSRGLVLGAALLGIPLAVARRRYVALILWAALLPPFLHAVLIIPDAPQERYGLTFVVVVILLAALGVADGAAWLARRSGPRLPSALSPSVLAGLALGVMLLVHQNWGQAIERAAAPPRSGDWLRQVRALGIGPNDLVMSDLPTVGGWYLGDLDYWISSREYHKYTFRTGDLPRDVHTGAILVRNVADFRRLVAEPNQGRTLWVLASRRSYQWDELVDDDFKRLLERAATRQINPGDGSRILQIDL